MDGNISRRRLLAAATVVAAAGVVGVMAAGLWVYRLISPETRVEQAQEIGKRVNDDRYLVDGVRPELPVEITVRARDGGPLPRVLDVNSVSGGMNRSASYSAQFTDTGPAARTIRSDFVAGDTRLYLVAEGFAPGLVDVDLVPGMNGAGRYRFTGIGSDPPLPFTVYAASGAEAPVSSGPYTIETVPETVELTLPPAPE